MNHVSSFFLIETFLLMKLK